MNTKTLLKSAILLLLPVFCGAQDLNSKVLLKIGENNISAGEFMRMCRKNATPGEKMDIDSYLQDYILFKLKVTDAINEGIDTTTSFKNELNGYREQLAKNYLTDTKVKDKMLQEAYERSLVDLNGWHILISLPKQPTQEDTLKAWKKAMAIRERIIRGEEYEMVAKAVSDDPTSKQNGGNIGYFTVFQAIKPFEDAAYSLKLGEISQPVRTQYGYHLIRVTDRRPSPGKVLVAHIMKEIDPFSNMEEDQIKAKAKEDIYNIYDSLQAGASFAEMAKKYSDDKATAPKGGQLDWFGTGDRMVSAFAEAAFSLKDTGSYTEPIKSEYGWHIIKLLGKRSPGSFEKLKSLLERKLNKSYLNSLCKKSFIEKLKNEYKLSINQKVADWFIKNTDTLTIKGIKKYNNRTLPKGDVYSFADVHFTANDLAEYIENLATPDRQDTPEEFINNIIENHSIEALTKYESALLEEKYPEFKNLMDEFHDGILLFEISGEKVWNRVNDDSVKLHQYYEDHKNNYMSSIGINAKIYILKSPDGEKELSSAYNKYSKKRNIDKFLNKQFNNDNDTMLIIKSGIWYKGDDPDLDNIQWVPGSSFIKKDSFPAVVVVKETVEPSPKPFEKVQGEIMTEYQEELEKEWERQLRDKYAVNIDKSVFEEVKHQLTNE